jgi:hypothetical protein
MGDVGGAGHQAERRARPAATTAPQIMQEFTVHTTGNAGLSAQLLSETQHFVVEDRNEPNILRSRTETHFGLVNENILFLSTIRDSQRFRFSNPGDREMKQDCPMCFRPTDELRQMLNEAAKREHRTLAGEVLHRLAQSFAAETRSRDDNGTINRRRRTVGAARRQRNFFIPSPVGPGAVIHPLPRGSTTCQLKQTRPRGASLLH